MPEQQHIKEELGTLAPGLPVPAPAMPFAVPPGYFEQLPAAVLERIRLEQDEIPEVLRSLKEKNASQPGWPFQVPTGYFEQQEHHRTPQQTAATTQEQTPVVSLHKRPFIKWVAAAAILLLIIAGGRWYQQRQHPDIETDPGSWVRKEIEGESIDKIESYVEANLIESVVLNTDDKKEIALLTKDISQEEILYLLSETAPLSTSVNEPIGQQKILN